MADLAYAFGWGPGELNEMAIAELLVWHGQLDRIAKQQEAVK